jgi:hypothetical protein
MTSSQIQLGSDTVNPRDILDAFNDPTHNDPTVNRDAEKNTALQAVAYVLGRNFKAAEASAGDGVFSLNIKLTFDRNDVPTTIKAVARCSRVSKADIELTCPQDD